MNRHLSDKFKHDRVKPPTPAWDKIEQQLNNPKKKPINGRKWGLMVLGLVLFAAGLSGIVAYSLLRQDTATTAPAEKILSQNEKAVEKENIASMEKGSEAKTSAENNSGTGNTTGKTTIKSNTSKNELKKSDNKILSGKADEAPVIKGHKKTSQKIAEIKALSPEEIPAEVAATEIKEQEFPIEQSPLALADSLQHEIDDNEIQQPKMPLKNRIAVSLIGTPEQAYRILSVNSSEPGVEDHIDFRNSIEKPRLGSDYGIRLSYMLNPKVTLNSGLFFSHKGERVQEGFYPTSFATGSDTAYDVYIIMENSYRMFLDNTSVNNYVSAVNRYHYIGVPVELQYNITQNRIGFYVAAGAGFNYLISAQTTIIERKSRYATAPQSIFIDRFNRFNMQIHARAGVEYELNNNLSILAEPVYKRSINSVLPGHNAMGYFHNSLGVSFGIKWRPMFKE